MKVIERYLRCVGNGANEGKRALLTGMLQSTDIKVRRQRTARHERYLRADFVLRARTHKSLCDKLLPLLIAAAQDGWTFVLGKEPQPVPPALLFMDLDGTLLRGEMMVLLADAMGHEAEAMKRLTQMTMDGVLPFDTSFRHRVGMLKGLPSHLLAKVTEEMPVVPDLADLLTLTHCPTFVVTGGFGCFARTMVQRFGLAGCLCTEAEVVEDKLTGRCMGGIVTPRDKATYVGEQVQKYRRTPAWVVGDGANDIEMLQAADTAVIYNAITQYDGQRTPIGLCDLMALAIDDV